MKKLFTLSWVLSFLGILISSATAQTNQSNGSFNKPTTPESKLISSYSMEFDGVEYKRNYDSMRYFSTIEAHLDQEKEDMIMFDVYSIYFKAPKIPADHIWPVQYDSANLYSLNTSETAYDHLRENIHITRNINGQITQYWEQENIAGTWTDVFRYTLLYNANNQPTELLYETFSGTWVNNRKKIFTYDTANHLEANTELIWASNGWVNDRKDIYGYDVSGNCISAIHQTASGNLWENNLKVNYSYDSNLRVSEIVTETWDVTEWKMAEKLIYGYLGEKIFSRTLLYFVGGIWGNGYKRTNTYNGDQLSSSLLEVGNNAGGWQNQTLYENTYTSGAITSSVISSYYNVWEQTFKITLSRNAHNQITQAQQEQKNGNGNWESYGYAYRFFYEEEGTGIYNLAKTLKLAVYPNPSKTYFSAELNWEIPENANLTLCDIQGNVLYEKDLGKSTYQKETLNVSHLSNGIYFLTISTKDGKTTKKVEVIK